MPALGVLHAMSDPYFSPRTVFLKVYLINVLLAKAGDEAHAAAARTSLSEQAALRCGCCLSYVRIKVLDDVCGRVPGPQASSYI